MIAWQATVQDDEGNIIVNPAITVRLASDDSLADIFDSEGVALANPFTGSSEGFCQFFAQPGEYRVQGVRGGSVTQTWTVTLAPKTGKQYATRAAFVADAGYAPDDGTVVSAGGVQYVRDASATVISDLPGWLPFGVTNARHFMANSGDTAGFQSALNYATHVQYDQEYHIDAITLRDGQLLEGVGSAAVLNFSDSNATSSDQFIDAIGTLDPGVEITGSLDRYSDTIPCPGHGLAVGDWFRIISPVSANSADAGEDRLGDRADVVPLTETHQVESAPDADTITIRGALRFACAAGTVVAKINPVSDIELRNVKVECGDRNVRAATFTLCQNLKLNNIELRNVGVSLLLRGCFDGTVVNGFKAYGAPDHEIERNIQFLKIVDGCVGVCVYDIDMANGGQMIDVTYTPSGDLASPVLDTLIQGGSVRNAYRSAITDHPTSIGTRVSDFVMHNVRSAVFIRSRGGRVSNIKAVGTGNPDGLAGIWAGENGYWQDLQVSDCLMVNFDTGYLMSGQGDTLLRRDAILSNCRSEGCRVGETWGVITSQGHCGSRSTGSRHIRPIETGIRVSGNWVGLEVRGFFVRGVVINAGVDVASNLSRPVFEGQVFDLGSGIPALKVSSGTPNNMYVDIAREGTCGFNDGVTPSMVVNNLKTIGVRTTSASVSGVTEETDIHTQLCRIPPGSFGDGATLHVQVRGATTGTGGTKSLRLRVGSSQFSSILTLPAVAGSFVADFYFIGTGPNEQYAHASFAINGGTEQSVTASSRTITLIDGSGTLRLTGQLADAGDSITVRAVEVKGSWA